MSLTVAIVDYGLCNLDSIARAVEEAGCRAVVTADSKDVEQAGKIIIPGVGAFSEAMKALEADGLDETLHEQVIDRKIPCLGICLGMQLMASVGFEGREVAGLGWFDAEVRRLDPGPGHVRIPHIGWNDVMARRTDTLFRGIPPGQSFYFVHSYRLMPRCDEEILGWTDYGAGFVAAIERENVFGVQFHPEKSQKVGLRLLRNFLEL